MAEQGFLLQTKHLFEIKDGGGEWARIGAGISSVEPSANDELAQDVYLDGEGLGETDVIGAQLILAFSGHRKYGDPAQDYIFNTLMKLGPGRRTELRWTLPNGDMLEGPVTIANLSGPSGDAGGKGEIEFELHFNGEPKFTPADETGGVEG